MKTSESITSIAVALHKFHGLMGKVGKDAVNPHFKNKYASLSNIIEATTPHLNAVGLSIIQLPCESGLETRKKIYISYPVKLNGNSICMICSHFP